VYKTSQKISEHLAIQFARGEATPTYYLPARFITMTEVSM
jgi:hypothetical protein